MAKNLLWETSGQCSKPIELSKKRRRVPALKQGSENYRYEDVFCMHQKDCRTSRDISSGVQSIWDDRVVNNFRRPEISRAEHSDEKVTYHHTSVPCRVFSNIVARLSWGQFLCLSHWTGSDVANCHLHSYHRFCFPHCYLRIFLHHNFGHKQVWA